MAGFKYMVAVIMSFSYGIGFIPSVVVCVAGGVFGVAVYLFFGELITKLYQRYFVRKKKTKKPFVINWKKRAIIKAKQNHGLVGVAILTPIFLSVPVGTFVALALNYSFRRIILFMAVSFLGWSLLFFGVYEVSGLKLHEVIRGWFQ